MPDLFQPYVVEPPQLFQPYEPEQSWLDWGVSTGLRTAPGIAGGLIGGLAGGSLGAGAGGIGAVPGMWAGSSLGSSIGSGIGESLGQWYDGDEQNLQAIGTEAAIGLIPNVSKIPGVGAGLKAIGKYALGSALEGGVQGFAGSVPRGIAQQGNLFEPTKWELPSLEDATKQGVAAAAFGGVIGGGLGASNVKLQNYLNTPYSNKTDIPQGSPYGTRASDMFGAGYGPAPSGAGYGSQYASGIYGNQAPDFGPTRVSPEGTSYRATPMGNMDGDFVNPPSQALTPTGPIEPVRGSNRPIEPQPPVVTIRNPDASVIEYYRNQGYVSVPNMRSPEGYPQMVLQDFAGMYTGGSATAPDAQASVPPPAPKVPTSGRPSPFQEGFEPAGDTVEIPNTNITPDVINNLKQGGYELTNRTPQMSIFTRLMGDDSGTLDIQAIYRNLKTMLGRDPSAAELEAAQAREAGPADRTGLVAPFRGMPGSPEFDEMAKWYDGELTTQGAKESQAMMPDIERQIALERKIAAENQIPVRIPGRNGAAEWPPNSGNVANQVIQPNDVVNQPGLPMGPMGLTPEGPSNQQLAKEAVQRYRLQKIANAGQSIPEQQDLFAQTGEILGPENAELSPPSGLTKSDPYMDAKAQLDAMYRTGQVVDYEEELTNLNEMFGVMDGRSNEKNAEITEIMRANDEGYNVYSSGYKGTLSGPIARTFTENGETFRVAGYAHLVSPDNPTGRYIKETNQLKSGISEDSIEPQFARVRGGGKMSVNINRTIEQVTKDYSGHIPAIIAKESIQNAVDAIKKLQETTSKAGKVVVRHTKSDDGKEHFFTIEDNGLGMTRAQMYKYYTTLFESGKADDPNASGGKGIGKGVAMFGGKYFKIESVAEYRNGEKVKVSLEGTPQELSGDKFVIDYELMNSSTPTGTRLTTQLLETDDTSLWAMGDMIDDMIKYSRDTPGKILFDKYGYRTNVSPHTNDPDFAPFKTRTDDKLVMSSILPGNTNLDIIVPDGKIKKSSYLTYYVLNNGLYQFKKTIYLDEQLELPEYIIADIRPTAKEGNIDYPFPMQRESLKEPIKLDLERQILDYIVNPSANRRKNDLNDLWNGMQPLLYGGRRESKIFDPGSRLTPDELDELKNSQSLLALAKEIDDFTDMILLSGDRQEAYDKLSRTGIILDPNIFGIYIPNPNKPKIDAAILINHFAHMSKHPDSPEDAALELAVTILHESAHILPGLNPERVPLNIDARDMADPRVPKFMKAYLDEVIMQGGLGKGHEADFIRRLAELFARTGTRTVFDATDRIAKIFRGDSPTGRYSTDFQNLLRIYEDSRGRPETVKDILSSTGINQSNPNAVREGSDGSSTKGHGTGISGFQPYIEPTQQHLGVMPFGGYKEGGAYDLSRQDLRQSEIDNVAKLMDHARKLEAEGNINGSRESRRIARSLRYYSGVNSPPISRAEELMATAKLKEIEGNHELAVRMKEKADRLFLEDAGQLTLSYLKSRAASLKPELAKAGDNLNEDNLEYALSHEYAKSTLGRVQSGPPGLKIEELKDPWNVPDTITDYKIYTITYRNGEGTPIAYAEVMTDSKGAVTNSLVANKDAGLMYGRALKAVGQEIIKFGAAKPSGAYSMHTAKLLKRLVDFVNDDSGAINLSAIGDAWNNLKRVAGWSQGRNGKAYGKAQSSWITEMLMLPAAATTTMDLSAPGRQGLAMINTPQFWRAAGAMFKGLTPSGFAQIDADLRAKPLFQRQINRRTGQVTPSFAEQVGLKLFTPASQPGPHAQATASRWIETGGSIPGFSSAYSHTVGVPVRASNRAFITFLNHLNANRFEYLMNRAQDMSLDAMRTGSARTGVMPWKQSFSQEEAMDLDPYRNLEIAKEIAEFVNTATGHGPLKTHLWPARKGEKSLEIAADKLGKVIFSPGLLASRVRLLNPNTYVMATPFVRKQYLQALIGTILGYSAVATMIKMAAGRDAEVGTEPTSADFGKIRIGNTRIDPSGGFLPYLVLGSRLWSGGYTSSATDQYRGFGEGFQATTQWTNLERFGANKLAPSAKFAYDLASASQYKPFHVKDRIMQMFIPLVIQDFHELMQEDPDLLPVGMLPITFGAGTQIYDKGESVGKFIAPEDDWLVTGGGFSDLAPIQ